VFLGVANPFLHTDVPVPNENHDLDASSDADGHSDPTDELSVPKEKEDKRVGIPIGIKYTIWVEKKFNNNQVPSRWVKCVPAAKSIPWTTNITGWDLANFKRGVAATLYGRTSIMDAILEAEERQVLRWSGFLSGDTQFPKT
jgi:hypothetical protein